MIPLSWYPRGRWPSPCAGCGEKIAVELLSQLEARSAARRGDRESWRIRAQFLTPGYTMSQPNSQRNGYLVATTSRNAQGVDVLASTASGVTVAIQVKTESVDERKKKGPRWIVAER